MISFIGFIGLIFLFGNNLSNAFIKPYKSIYQISNPINKIKQIKQNKLMNCLNGNCPNPGNCNNSTLVKKTDNIQNNKFYHYGLFPRMEGPNEKGELTWYPIGFSQDFGLKPQRVTIRDINYIVWKDKSDYYGLRDCCSHQGSSFMLGVTCKNTISCPYHGYIFDGNNGELIQIPKLEFVDSESHNIECFKVVEKGDMVYFNTIPIIKEEDRDKIDELLIFTEPEFTDKNQRVVYLTEDFDHYAKFVSVNSLDICHIGFVHTFGNRKSPNPLHNSKVLTLDDYKYHYKIIYEYVAGEESLVNKIYNIDNIIVENEYALPHSTVARVKFSNYTSTIITHALPISKFKTKLFVKAYRSYWAYDLTEKKYFNPFYHFQQIINTMGDIITKNTMYNTLKQDKGIVDNIDKTDYISMHGKFSIVYDMFSNHYKKNYKKFYEDQNMII
jgi:phenylpropionate dioxygenase-like ring-hydroxylating dioxygenase large terminal subunit